MKQSLKSLLQEKKFEKHEKKKKKETAEITDIAGHLSSTRDESGVVHRTIFGHCHKVLDNKLWISCLSLYFLD